MMIPPEAQQLTEATSINLVQQIKREAIATPLCDRPIPTAYVRQGTDNPPILLLHGFDSSVLEFRRLLPLLSPTRETWSVDLLGFGFTERIPGISFGATAIKIHLHCFWKALIQQPIVIIGASMGGAAAIDFTLTYPEVVEKLILLDSAGLAKPPLGSKLMFPPLDSLATEFLRNARVRQQVSRAAYYNKRFASADAQRCAALHVTLPGWNRALAAFTKSGGYGSFAPQLPQIQQPTLIVWGENDQILGTKVAHQFEQAIPKSQLIWIEQCGHVPHLEKPQATADRILGFLALS